MRRYLLGVIERSEELQVDLLLLAGDLKLHLLDGLLKPLYITEIVVDPADAEERRQSGRRARFAAAGKPSPPRLIVSVKDVGVELQELRDHGTRRDSFAFRPPHDIPERIE